MTRIDEIIANALAGIPETDVAILAREVVRLRGATSVVVPAWDVNAFALACVKEGAYAEGDLRNAIKNAEMGYNFAVSRAYTIPADRVLGDGMEAVGHEELEWLKSLYSWMSAADEGGVKVSFSLTEFPEVVACLKGIANSLAALDSIRANQGGASA